MSSSLNQLSVRAHNCVNRMGLTTWEEVRAAVKSKRLHPSNPKALGIGWKTYREILDYVGIKQPMTPQQVCVIRSQIAFQLRSQCLNFAEISTIMRLGSKEVARQYVARGQRLAEKK